MWQLYVATREPLSAKQHALQLIGVNIEYAVLLSDPNER